MKFVISLLFTTSAMASPIRLYYEGKDRYAFKLKQTLVETYFIPDELVGLNAVENCSRITERGRMDLCLKNNGDLLVVSIDHEFVTESLRIFRTP